ncbi:glycosyltransferase [Methylicorpusculum sp.]|uniref:glycosyltransferase n=1 Tax=Methylicorpusculum sp. TaxID=2713644 RepID=UPI002723C38B|nr:glycosyltransferase [Methylicorpusculum sp.]MDO8843247.1 glycosyltransferase [Methylicorpusculum sp.]
MNNKVSVIIRTGASRVGCLEQAIDSISSQLYKNIEVVIVENGSKGLQEWLANKKFENCELRYYQQTEANRCSAGNLGLEVARGNYVCFLDDDDIFYPNHINLLVAALEENNAAVAAYSLSHEVKSQIDSYTPFQCKDKTARIVFRQQFSRGALFVNNYLPIQSVLFRKTLFEQYGGFDVSLQRLEDWDLWVRYASQSEFVFVDVATSMYRMPINRKISGIRNREHDEYYPFVRAKQSQITTIFDQNLFDEMIEEIFRCTKISMIILRLIYDGKLSKQPLFKKICTQWGLSFNDRKSEITVLDAIKLTSEVITQYKLLWNIHRTEFFIRQKIKQIVFR